MVTSNSSTLNQHLLIFMYYCNVYIILIYFIIIYSCLVVLWYEVPRNVFGTSESRCRDTYFPFSIYSSYRDGTLACMNLFCFHLLKNISTTHLAQSVERWTVNRVIQFDSSALQATFIVNDHKVLSTVYCTTALACTEVTSSFLQKWRHLVPGKLLDSLPRVVELYSGEFNMALPWSFG